MADKKDLVIEQGRTFDQVVRWETEPVVFKAISAIQQNAPCTVTSTAHGVPDGWRVAIQSVKGMTDLNASADPPKKADYYVADPVDANTIQLVGVNAADFKAYTSGGYLRYNTPQDLTGFTAQMTIKDRVGGTELLALTTANNRIVIDTVNYKITLRVSAADTALIAWSKGVYDLEMVSSLGEVYALLTGAVTVQKEITT